MKDFDPSILRVGDALLYRPHDMFGYVIWLKTWTRISHIEVYAGVIDGQHMSFASRDGKGVDLYPLRTAQLGCVRRPKGTIDLFKFEAYGRGCEGQHYATKSLGAFALLTSRATPGQQFCSQFGTNLYRAAGFDPFNPDVDAVTVAPAEFYQSGCFTDIWKDAP